MNAFFEQKKDQAFDRLQMSALRGGDSGGPFVPPDDEGG